MHLPVDVDVPEIILEARRQYLGHAGIGSRADLDDSAILVGAEREGQGKTADGPGAIRAEVGA